MKNNRGSRSSGNNNNNNNNNQRSEVLVRTAHDRVCLSYEELPGKGPVKTGGPADVANLDSKSTAAAAATTTAMAATSLLMA